VDDLHVGDHPVLFGVGPAGFKGGILAILAALAGEAGLTALQLPLQLHDFVSQLLVHARQQLHLPRNLLAADCDLLLVRQLCRQHPHPEVEAVAVAGELLDAAFEVGVFSLELCVAGVRFAEVVRRGLQLLAEGAQTQTFREEFGVVLTQFEVGQLQVLGGRDVTAVALG
jgi:hypothetical protein